MVYSSMAVIVKRRFPKELFGVVIVALFLGAGAMFLKDQWQGRKLSVVSTQEAGHIKQITDAGSIADLRVISKTCVLDSETVSIQLGFVVYVDSQDFYTIKILLPEDAQMWQVTAFNNGVVQRNTIVWTKYIMIGDNSEYKIALDIPKKNLRQSGFSVKVDLERSSNVVDSQSIFVDLSDCFNKQD